MKNEDNKKPEQKVKSTNTNNEEKKGREHIDPIDKNKETLEERAKREGWTDVIQSHLGIDE